MHRSLRILSLVMLFLELCDPSCAFIRVTHRPLRPAHAQLVISSQLTPTLHCVPEPSCTVERAAETTSPQSLLDLETTPTHSATSLWTFALTLAPVLPLWLQQEHVLLDQYHARGLERPPLPRA